MVGKHSNQFVNNRIIESKPIHWESEESHILLNPCLIETFFKEDSSKENLERIGHLHEEDPKLRGHLWFLTSGTTGGPKWVALSKVAFLEAAQSVNDYLEIVKEDRFLNVLPEFHVGGLAIEARAYLSGSSVNRVDDNWKWNPSEFTQKIIQEKTTLTSLVPTQVFDLVTDGQVCPGSLRAVVVGGDRLSTKLYTRARELGWPLLPSYGMTETSALVAGASLDSLQEKKFPKVEILSHMQIKEGLKGFLCFKGKGLLTGYYLEDGFIDPKSDGWFKSEDRGVVMNGGDLSVLGRGNGFFKIKGENISLFHLREKWSQLSLSLEHHLSVTNDERQGKSLILLTKNPQEGEILKKQFNKQVNPFERIDKIVVVSEILRTELGKVIEEKQR